MEPEQTLHGTLYEHLQRVSRAEMLQFVVNDIPQRVGRLSEQAFRQDNAGTVELPAERTAHDPTADQPDLTQRSGDRRSVLPREERVQRDDVRIDRMAPPQETGCLNHLPGKPSRRHGASGQPDCQQNPAGLDLRHDQAGCWRLVARRHRGQQSGVWECDGCNHQTEQQEERHCPQPAVGAGGWQSPADEVCGDHDDCRLQRQGQDQLQKLCGRHWSASRDSIAAFSSLTSSRLIEE